MTREEEFFTAASALPAAGRAAYLDAACAGEPEVRARVEALLRSDEATAFMEGGAVAARFMPYAPEQPGEMIGRYKLLQQIGEGGFGTVWMAEQMEPVSRRVALKIIKLGMDTREVIARFEAERQALAMMDHPNIAKVFDAGATDKGRPFFVMELVKGIPITQFCDEKQFGTRERLLLFADVCSAINHAHQKGVIHRDVKPSNVMVTLHGDKAVPKVIDFGIAKATQGKLTDKSLFTRFEQFIGTPAYMSPEQAALSGVDIDTRSDIYALGILLYELLTGKPPFDSKSLAAAGYEEMRRIIREEEPPRPSSRLSTMAGAERTTLARARRIEPEKLRGLVEPDLDWIVMKAIEKDRTRRYETANALALDIQHFLADEPVSAMPPGAAYRFRKFARRNKTALRVAAGIALVLVAATAVSTWQAVRATEAGELAKKRLVEAAAERDAKEEARKDAESIATFLSEVFQSPDPGRDGRSIKVAELLDTAAKKLETDLASQPGRRTKLQSTLGDTFHALGLYPEAIALREKVRDCELAARGLEHPDTITAMSGLALSLHRAGQRAEALSMRGEVLALRRKVLGPEHPATLSAMTNLAVSLFGAGRPDEALKLQEEALSLCRKVEGPEAAATLGAMTNLAAFCAETGHLARAVEMQEQALAIKRRTLLRNHPFLATAMGNLAEIYRKAGRKEEALKLGEEALALSRKVLGPDHADTLKAIIGLALSCDAAGHWADAVKLWEEALELSRKLSSPEHEDTLGVMNSLAFSYRAAGRWAGALKLRDELLVLRRKVNGPEHLETLAAMHNLASSLDTGRHDEALKLREEVLTLRRKVQGLEHPLTLMAMSNLAISYSEADRPEEALKLREEVLVLYRKVSGPEAPDTLKAMSNLAVSYSEAGRAEGALKLHEEMLQLSRKVNGPESPDTLAAMTDLAGSLDEAGRLAEAIKMQEQALVLKRRVLPPNHPFLATALGNMADLYDKDGRKDEAAGLRRELAGKANPSPPEPAPEIKK